MSGEKERGRERDAEREGERERERERQISRERGRDCLFPRQGNIPSLRVIAIGKDSNVG